MIAPPEPRQKTPGPRRPMSNQIQNVHDAFFKQVLGDPELAGQFLREHLPREVTSLLGPEAPQPIPGSFVDEELQQHHSDLIFRVHLNTGGAAFAYVLMEHKSAPDRMARLQLLRYVVRLLSQWREQNKKQLHLPPVLPLLVHQGLDAWNLSCEFADLFGAVAEPLRPYLPSFRHALVDLAPMEDGALSSQLRLRAFLKALKYGRRPDLKTCFYAVLAEAPELGERDLSAILTYFEKGPLSREGKVIRDTLRRLVPDRMERIMGELTQPYYDKGRAEGKAEGKAEGLAEGEARILAHLLEKRFGAISGSVRQRIFTAEAATIETWVERVLDAPDLQSVFASN
jgi:predicted transposase/invertase (TIGR01784 family)